MDPAIDAAVDDALRRPSPLSEVTSAHYEEAATVNGVIVSVEGWEQNGHLLGDPAKLSGRIHRRIQQMQDVSEAGMLDWALGLQKSLRAELDAILARHAAIALPVLTCVAPNPTRRTNPTSSSPR